MHLIGGFRGTFLIEKEVRGNVEKGVKTGMRETRVAGCGSWKEIRRNLKAGLGTAELGRLTRNLPDLTHSTVA